MKHYKSFLIKIPIFLVIISIVYVLFTIFLIKASSAHLYSFKDYLISNTVNRNRIIIESGSNSYHGINSEMLENYFNTLTVNLSDNGGYPLNHKLYRIAKFAKNGDIVILPLEYRYYINDNAPNLYYDGIFFELHHYYDHLPFLQKISLIFRIPPSSFIKTLIRNYNNSHTFKENLKNLIYFNDRSEYDFISDLKSGNRGDYKYTGKIDPATDMNIPCQDYIFFDSLKNDKIIINDIFKDNLNLAKNIQKEKGIKFIFTYPVVVGDKCYDLNHPRSKQNQLFLKEIKKFVISNDFDFIGDYQDSYFSSQFLLDTWFHVVPSARDIRTKKLIENLEKLKFIKELHNKQ